MNISIIITEGLKLGGGAKISITFKTLKEVCLLVLKKKKKQYCITNSKIVLNVLLVKI